MSGHDLVCDRLTTNRRQPAPPAITNAYAQALLEYWIARRGSAVVPPRRAIDPADIADLLPLVHLLDRRADGRFVWRLVGTELTGYYGRNLAGETFDPAGVPSHDRRFSIIYRTITNQPCGADIRCLARTRSGRVLPLETIALPLLDDAGRPTKILAHSEPIDLEHPRLRHICQFTDLRIERVDIFDIGAGLPSSEVARALLEQEDGSH